MGENKDGLYLGNVGLPTVDATFSWTPEMVDELDRCRKSILQFANHFTIVSLDEGKIKINLRGYQKRILKALAKNRLVAILSSRQSGKALDINTPIKIPTGWTTMGELKDNDQVYDELGNICNVIKAWPVMHDRPCYNIEFSNGESIVADEEHLWYTETFYDRKQKRKGSKKTTKELLSRLTINQKNKQPFHRIPIGHGIKGSDIELDCDPYLLGYWLGDGSSHNGHIAVGLQDINAVENILKSKNIQFNTSKKIGGFNNGEYCNVYINRFDHILTSLDIRCNKHIPANYFNASYQQRLDLLRGLMDTDGTVRKNGQLCTFYNTNKILVDDVVNLLHTLGCHNPTVSCRINFCNGKQGKDMYRINFALKEKAFLIPRKSDSQIVKNINHDYVYIKNITPVESRPVRCITVDSPNAMFLCGKSLIPTSNTTLMTIYALWIICFKPDQRILIIANKEKTAISIFSRIRLAYEKLPNYLKPGVATYGKTGMSLGNGSSIGISTTSSDAARGESINCLTKDSNIRIKTVDKLIYDIDFERLTRIITPC
jgi:hypothetical protein